ncbi:TetR/AcrR family transcriptional regulator [Murdochiella vaginalis]|uniref:TetR/AcrR family transcriptional regulator n=1 Tax=Murdochiella vaginalis TaxID=1852373 RepID=UPI0008FD9B74|nr:TetR/AcrR family transcriptional regulator [Murdochiella vaginalis]
MPTGTYFRLGDDKRKAIYCVLVDEFKSLPLEEITVKRIVERLHLPRGSFYQYFSSLNDCYFYVLDQELTEVHSLFARLIAETKGNLFAALDAFGDAAAELLYDPEHYGLYRQRYLFMNAALEREWRRYREESEDYTRDIEQWVDPEKVDYLRAVVHHLIRRLFSEEWSREEFLSQYRRYLGWLKGGLQNDESDGTVL